MIADPTAVVTSRPLPQVPLTGVPIDDRSGLSGDAVCGVASAGLRRALDVAARGRDIFHDPFADDLGEPAAAPPRLVLLATDDDEPGQAALRRTGRAWPSTDLLHPVEEVPRGARHAAVLRAALLASRLDVAAVYLGLGTRTIEPA